MAFNIFRYKSEQGKLARGIAFWLLTALSGWGCRTLFYFLHWDWATQNLLNENIPIIDTPLSPALIISIVLFFVFELIIIHWVVNRPKIGDLLIETEIEMKKVTWPSWNDAFNSSIVIFIAVIFFMVLLGLSDFLFNQFFSEIVFGAVI